jgi:cytochrome c oxidase assembly protein subunit 15
VCHPSEHLLNPESKTILPAHHRFTKFWAFCVFLLIIAGALVTSHAAGLSVPDWPTSFGSLYKIPPMVGGIKYEHGHRMLAEFIGLLTIVFAVWTQRSDSRAWMRKLGWWALFLVIFQGVLGGLTVRLQLPWYVSTFHAMVAQSFFALTVLAVLFTANDWETSPHHDIVEPDSSIRWLTILSVIAVYWQLFFGAAFRHNGFEFLPAGTRILPHIVGAGFATAILVLTGLKIMMRHRNVPELRRYAHSLLGLLGVQLLLGVAALVTRLIWGKNALQPLPSMVWSTVAHVTVGALLLSNAFILAVLVDRRFAKKDQPPEPHFNKAVA